MSKLQLVVIDKDIPADAISCGEKSIDALMQQAYPSTLFKQGRAYNILIDDKLIGSCMIRFVSLYDKDAEYYVGHKDYTALEISYLAIDSRIQGHGYGRLVLKQLILLARRIADDLPVRVLVLDAFKDKEEWYTSAGFKISPKKKDLRYPGTLPMRMDLIDKKLAENYAQSFM